MKAWMRVLTVSFTSSKLKKKFVFGENYLQGKDDLSIDVQIHKYMSSLKDNCTVKISNLPYDIIVQLIQGEYYDLEIKAGYRNTGTQTVFKGGVLYMSNSLDDTHTNTLIVLGASNLVAKYGQSRINLTLNSGINMYSALNYICKKANIPNSNISSQLKKSFIQDITNVNQTAASFLNTLAENNKSIIINADQSVGSPVTMYDASKSKNRVIKLKKNFINLVGGFPQLDSTGLRLNIMPTFNIMCGDVIDIDNSIIDISVDNGGSYSNFTKGYYLDKDGMYTVYEVTYSLQNRGSSFSAGILAKSYSLISSIL